ncbi:LOB domain-containing protein 23 [Orobanche minor]
MSSGHRRCAACKHLRRRCPSDCIFSPYFPSNNPRRFALVHKIYGASNVGKLLEDLPIGLRAEAADSLYYEAYCRIKDPVYGCVGMISVLHQQIYDSQCQLDKIQAEIAALMAIRSQSRDENNVSVFFFPDQNDHVLSGTAFDELSSWLA